MSSEPVPGFSFWNDGPMFEQFYHRKQVMDQILDELFAEHSWSLFPNMVFYLDMSPTIHASKRLELNLENVSVEEMHVDLDQINFAWRFLACEIRAFGGIVASSILPETTHIVLQDKSRGKLFKEINAKLTQQKRLVMTRWVSVSIASKTAVDESPYSV
jgi:hypothetical protein